MTRRLRCYIAAPRFLARQVTELHTMLECHNVKPMSLWADEMLATGNHDVPDDMLDPKAAKLLLERNRRAIAASDVVLGYLSHKSRIELPWEWRHSKGIPTAFDAPGETYCELEDARRQGKHIVLYGNFNLIPLSIHVARHEGYAVLADSPSNAIDIIARHTTDGLTGGATTNELHCR